jgi:PAS domain S-box-containing protein
MEPNVRVDLQTTLQRVKVPSFMADSNGVITWLNDAARAVFGELVGRSYATFVAPEDVPVAKEQLSRKLQGESSTDYEIDVFTRDGARHRAEISSVPIEGGADACHAIFGVALTDRRAKPRRAPASLTQRQGEVLQLLGGGASTDQIAAQLHLSTETVRNHVRQLLRALGAHSRLEAVAIARRQGLLDD